ncbi:hypothetical protein [Kitasatospora cineracea]|uniref:hypothetical protein n=1 Tax=Kitasatospora cineracea TaxID=88074 RepID=UPI00382EFCED
MSVVLAILGIVALVMAILAFLLAKLRGAVRKFREDVIDGGVRPLLMEVAALFKAYRKLRRDVKVMFEDIPDDASELPADRRLG